MVRVTNMETRTPIAQGRKQKITCPEILSSPSTPHRIELRNDSSEDNKHIKVSEPLSKSKKRLKNGSTFPNCPDVKNGNHKLTEYFPVRRSARKTSKIMLEEKQKTLEFAVKHGIEDGLEIRIFEDKGRGVVATKHFSKGEFVVEYSGELVDIQEAKTREEKYATNENMGCYMYYFKHNNQHYCVDATAESGRLGRLVNHSRNGNLVTKTLIVDNRPRLVLLAKDNIKSGQEVLYDYGDRSKESLEHHPWLAY